MNTSTTAKIYTLLSAQFLRGTFEGQLASISAAHFEGSMKTTEYLSAITNGDVTIPQYVTAKQAAQLMLLGVDENSFEVAPAAAGKIASKKAAANSSYPHLSAIFWKGKFDGQLASVYADRENTAKVCEYLIALAAKDAAQPEGGQITKAQSTKLMALRAIAGHSHPHSFIVSASRKAVQPEVAVVEAQPMAADSTRVVRDARGRILSPAFIANQFRKAIDY